MQYRLFPTQERGYADHGWLKTCYSFSFAHWYHPQKIHFGMLRVLNDDSIAAHSGFDFHSHNDMEIVTIMLEGTLTHQDSMGNKEVIKQNEVQVMSAGTGILHSEKNESDEWTKLFQIWIFPDKKGYKPRYGQRKFVYAKNQFELLVSPDGRENSLWVHQNAFVSRGVFDGQQKFSYTLYDENNGVYLMLISGSMLVGDTRLKNRDAIGLWECDKMDMMIDSKADILIIEVPMN